MKHKNIAYINMTALENNYRAIEKIVSENAEKKPRIIAVVKADAYGHGIENVAKALGDAGCDMYAVSSEEEAVELREVEEKNGRMPDILILSRISPENVADMIEKNITAAVTSYDNALALNDAAAEAGPAFKLRLPHCAEPCPQEVPRKDRAETKQHLRCRAGRAGGLHTRLRVR